MPDGRCWLLSVANSSPSKAASFGRGKIQSRRSKDVVKGNAVTTVDDFAKTDKMAIVEGCW